MNCFCVDRYRVRLIPRSPRRSVVKRAGGLRGRPRELSRVTLSFDQDNLAQYSTDVGGFYLLSSVDRVSSANARNCRFRATTQPGGAPPDSGRDLQWYLHPFHSRPANLHAKSRTKWEDVAAVKFLGRSSCEPVVVSHLLEAVGHSSME